MDPTYPFRKAMVRRLLDIVGVAALAGPALPLQAGCGRVVVDTDGAGGIPLEGWEYGNVTMTLFAATALSQYTAGMDDLYAGDYPQQIDFLRNRYWDDYVDGMRHTLSPSRRRLGHAQPGLRRRRRLSAPARLGGHRDLVRVCRGWLHQRTGRSRRLDRSGARRAL